MTRVPAGPRRTRRRSTSCHGGGRPREPCRPAGPGREHNDLAFPGPAPYGSTRSAVTADVPPTIRDHVHHVPGHSLPNGTMMRHISLQRLAALGVVFCTSLLGVESTARAGTVYGLAFRSDAEPALLVRFQSDNP